METTIVVVLFAILLELSERRRHKTVQDIKSESKKWSEEVVKAIENNKASYVEMQSAIADLAKNISDFRVALEQVENKQGEILRYFEIKGMPQWGTEKSPDYDMVNVSL